MPATRSRQSTAGPSSPLIRRRFTRATSHIDADRSETKSTSITPEGPTATSSPSAESTPERNTTEAEAEAESEDFVIVDDNKGAKEMLHREGAASRRSKNIEDINDIEEKGLYRTYSSSSLDSGVKERLLDEKPRGERASSEEPQGLSSRRDKEAFALLVVLCKLSALPRGLLLTR